MVAGSNPGRLPAGYTELAYLESTGTQYIDTGIKLVFNYGFAIKFLTKSALVGSGNYGCIFGGRQSSGVRDYQLTTYTASAKNAGSLRWGDSTNNAANPKIAINTILTCSLRNHVFTACDGTTKTFSTQTANSPQNAYIFGLNNGGSFAQSGSGCRVYYFKIYNGDTFVADYVPAMRDSDSVVGMYDLVSNTFLTNAGSGTFSYGTL